MKVSDNKFSAWTQMLVVVVAAAKKWRKTWAKQPPTAPTTAASIGDILRQRPSIDDLLDGSNKIVKSIAKNEREKVRHN